MSTSAPEFRFRYAIYAGIFVIGFLAPWNHWLHLDGGQSSWLSLAAILGRSGWVNFSQATVVLLLLAIMLTAIAAFLRTWASAFLGPVIVQDSQMHATEILSKGPYRYVRNPLYLGIVLHSLALGMLMSPGGAVVSVCLVVLLDWRLIRLEEHFLSRLLGASYNRYCAEVPSIIPHMRFPRQQPNVQAHWRQAITGEIYMWGAAVSFLALGWWYNAILIEQGLLVSFGISLVSRAIIPHRDTTTSV